MSVFCLIGGHLLSPTIEVPAALAGVIPLSASCGRTCVRFAYLLEWSVRTVVRRFGLSMQEFVCVVCVSLGAAIVIRTVRLV